MSVQSRLENNEKPTFLFKLTVGTDLSTASWTLNSGNVYKTTLSNNYIYSSCDYVSGTVINTLIEKTSVGALVQGSAFLDRDTSILYVWLNDDTNPSSKDVILKQFRFYSTSTINVNHDLTDGTTKNITWDGLAKFSPFNTIIDFASNNFKAYQYNTSQLVVNEEISNIVINQNIECYLGYVNEPTSEFIRIYSGIINDMDIVDNKTTIKISTELRDINKNLDADLYSTLVNDFGIRMHESQKNNIIQKIYGKVDGVRCTTLDAMPPNGYIPISVGTAYIQVAAAVGGGNLINAVGLVEDFLETLSPGDKVILGTTTTQEVTVSHVISSTQFEATQNTYTLGLSLIRQPTDSGTNAVIFKPYVSQKGKVNRKWVICGHSIDTSTITNVKYKDIEFQASDYTVGTSTFGDITYTHVTLDENIELDYVNKNAIAVTTLARNGGNFKRIDLTSGVNTFVHTPSSWGRSGGTFRFYTGQNIEGIIAGVYVYVGAAHATKDYLRVERVLNPAAGTYEIYLEDNLLAGYPPTATTYEYKTPEGIVDGSADSFVTVSCEGLDSGGSSILHPTDIITDLLDKTGTAYNATSFTDIRDNLTTSDYDLGIIIPRKASNKISDVQTVPEILEEIGKTAFLNLTTKNNEIFAISLDNNISNSVLTLNEVEVIKKRTSKKIYPLNQLTVEYAFNQLKDDEEDVISTRTVEYTKNTSLYGQIGNENIDTILYDETAATKYTDQREALATNQHEFLNVILTMKHITLLDVGDILTYNSKQYMVVSKTINPASFPSFVLWDMAGSFV